MNIKKYIWSAYILLWVYFIFFDTSYDQSSHIFTYLVFGWIPFLALHKLWRPNVSLNETSIVNNPEKRVLTNEIDINAVFRKVYKEHPEWREKIDDKK